MIDKYVDGMNEIKASNEFKSKMIRNIEQTTIKQTSIKQTYFEYKLKKLTLLACTFAFFILLGISFFGNNRFFSWRSTDMDKYNLKDFVITAYAADGSTIGVIPNVEFIIGKYQPTMSSVPGFPIKIVCTEIDSIKLTATDGEFLLWNPSNSLIQNKGKEIEIKSGDIVYWSPLNNRNVNALATNANTLARNATIQIKAYKDKKEKGIKSINIKSDDQYTYTAALLN